MRFSWDFLQNMLENGHSNLQTNLWVHITSNIFKISNSKITGSQTPPDLPTLKAYPTPGVGGRFGIFSLKWRERMNLKVPGAILPLGCAILSTRAKTVRGGWYNPALGELGLIKARILKILLHMCDTYNYDYQKHSTFRFNFIDFQLYIDFPFQFCVFYRKIT